ncbi:MAG: ATP-binding cassette domain-containing protein [Candidatus Caldarchaeum sp.]
MLKLMDLEVRRRNFTVSVDRLELDGSSVLLGRNGSGKSTLLRCIAGFIKPSKGKIIIDGVDVTDTPPAMRVIGYMPQEQVKLPLKPSKALEYFAKKFNVDPSTILKESGLDYILEKEALSVGESQIMNVAIILMRRPKLLLLDEPTSNFDFINKIAFCRFLKKLSIPMVYVTHDPLEASLIADRIYLMENGLVKKSYTNLLKEKAEKMLEEFNLYRLLDSVADFPFQRV